MHHLDSTLDATQFFSAHCHIRTTQPRSGTRSHETPANNIYRHCTSSRQHKHTQITRLLAKICHVQTTSAEPRVSLSTTISVPVPLTFKAIAQGPKTAVTGHTPTTTVASIQPRVSIRATTVLAPATIPRAKIMDTAAY